MNIVYLFYFLLKSDYSYLKEEIKKKNDKSTLKIISDIMYSTLRYGSSFEDYFIYDFLNKKHKERSNYVVTGLAHEFFKEMNDKNYVAPFRNKEVFDEKFKDFIKRDTIIIDKSSEQEFIKWCNNKNEIIIKPLDGVQGKGIYKRKFEDKDKDKVKEIFDEIKGKNYIVEEVIQQHPTLQELNPSCVNSIRIITININNKPKIIAAIFRIGAGGIVDNFSEGGIAAPIDLETGIVFKEGITKDRIIKLKVHPKTKVKIIGFKIPYWNEVKDIVLRASQVVPSIKTVGWDIAITKNGPDIIEGNDNWNKNIFQLPFDKGKKEELKEILKENKVK